MIDTKQICNVALELAGLDNLTPDSGIWMPSERIRKMLFGIDVGTAEIQIAQQLGYDLVMAHHPPEATLEAWKDYVRHVDLMVAAGVPKKTAEKTIAGAIRSMKLGAHARNNEHTVSVARLLKMPFMNIHTPLDEIGRKRLQDRFDLLVKENDQASVGDVFQALKEFPEVTNAPVDPFIAVGNVDDPAGKIVVAHGALDIPNYPMLEAYYAHGVNTILTLRVSLPDLERLEEKKMGALIVIGHMAGDNLGFTPFLERLRNMGIVVDTFSGVIDLQA
ncbi:MAG: hypothetical protein JXA42_04090 [Anaerolineales bacterium]|nr:hypothetical protein [Anaerolineales bacterium]